MQALCECVVMVVEPVWMNNRAAGSDGFAHCWVMGRGVMHWLQLLRAGWSVLCKRSCCALCPPPRMLHASSAGLACCIYSVEVRR